MGDNPSLRVLFLTLYPETIPSSRLRVYQYLSYLREAGIETKVLPSLPEPWFSRLYFSNSKILHFFQFALEALFTFLRIWQARKFDIVFIQKGILSTNLRGFEKLLSFVKRSLIFDLDDLVYGQSPTEFGLPLLKFLQDASQTKKISNRSRVVIAGNEFLKEEALQYNSNVFVIPTPVDTNRFLPANKSNTKETVIGWTGMETTLGYLFELKNVLSELSKRYPIRLKIITRIGRWTHPFEGFPVDVVPWSYETEVNEMSAFDIGVMPLPKELWSEGKCGLKLLQYMSMEIAGVASRTKANQDIVGDGKDGFLAENEEEWISKLSVLIENSQKRKEMGERARSKVVEHYSLEKSAGQLIKILRTIGQKKMKKVQVYAKT